MATSLLHSFALLHKFGDLFKSTTCNNSLCGINYFHQIEMKFRKVNLCPPSEFLFSFYHFFVRFCCLLFLFHLGKKAESKRFGNTNSTIERKILNITKWMPDWMNFALETDPSALYNATVRASF